VVVAVAADARLVHLTIDDVIDHDGQVFIRFGDPGPGPRTFAAMLTELAANRATMNTAANPPACGCSPADTPASPLPWRARPTVPRARSRGHSDPHRNVPPVPSAGPAPVVARPWLHPGTATCHVIAADGTWHRYPASHAGS